MTTKQALIILKSIHLPPNCRCGDPACNTTVAFRLTHPQKEVLQQLIDKVLAENPIQTTR